MTSRSGEATEPTTAVLWVLVRLAGAEPAEVWFTFVSPADADEWANKQVWDAWRVVPARFAGVPSLPAGGPALPVDDDVRPPLPSGV